MTTIPASIDEVTAEWLADATGLAVDTVEHSRIGMGIGVSSAVYRSALTGTDVPDTVVVKLPALAEEAVFTSTMLRMYIREVRFFEQMAARSPIRVPECHHGAVDPDTSAFVLVMEDMGDMRIVDQIAGMEIADAERAVHELAAWHAAFWGRGEELSEAGTVVSLGDPVYPAVLPLVFAEGWEKLTTGLDIGPEIDEIGLRWVDAMPGLLRSLVAGPTTALHGDYRGDNILFADDGSVVLLDFQLTGHGSAAYDLAYLLTQSLTAEVAAEHERALFSRWVEGLVAHGVDRADTDDLWEQYRCAAAFCLVYPVVACRGMDFEDPRQLDLLDVMNERFARAARQLDLIELV